MKKGSIVYLCDDDTSALKGLTRLLLAAGYEVNAYESPGELLKSTLTDENACLVLDVRMPALSGFDLQAELAAKGVKLPVIFVTAEVGEELRQEAMAIKAAGYFRKPVDGLALVDAIEWALGKEDKAQKGDLI